MSASDTNMVEFTERRELEAALAAVMAERDALLEEQKRLSAEQDKLRTAYRELKFELELLRRRIFVAKAERVDTRQLQLEFAAKMAELDELANKGGADNDEEKSTESQKGGDEKGSAKSKKKPTGRRNLNELEIPEERVELTDPTFDGKFPRIGCEESTKLAWRRGGFVRIVVARVKYRISNDQGDSGVETTPMPEEIRPRSLAAPSLLAHVASSKFCDGLPLHRLEDIFSRDGVPIDRGSMSRWLEDVGSTCGATVVHAMRTEAKTTAFCLATDATGIAIQPAPAADKKRQACKRGHFFVTIADRDHVFFDYQPRETSKAVAEMFRGFTGYVQADAKSVFDILFRPPDKRPKPDDDDLPPDNSKKSEVGCWAHARRKFWETAAMKCAVSREALMRIGRIFEHDQKWKGLPPEKVKAHRNQFIRPEVESFFTWARVENEKVKHARGALRSAFGYVIRHSEALQRFLEDGRLKLDNNHSERELRRIAVGRKAWLFAGSDDHAEATGHLFSLIASARLHDLDPELYLRDLFRVLAQWPRDRYLELAPRYWAQTRERLIAAELEQEVGPLTVPEVLTKAPSEPTPQESTAS